MIEEAKLQAKSIGSAAAAQQQQQMGSMFGSVLSGIGGMIRMTRMAGSNLL